MVLPSPSQRSHSATAVAASDAAEAITLCCPNSASINVGRQPKPNKLKYLYLAPVEVATLSVSSLANTYRRGLPQ